VDPLREKLPTAQPIDQSVKPRFLQFIAPLKQQLDNRKMPAKKPDNITEKIAKK
jgi:hypothetical protein